MVVTFIIAYAGKGLCLSIDWVQKYFLQFVQIDKRGPYHFCTLHFVKYVWGSCRQIATRRLLQRSLLHLTWKDHSCWGKAIGSWKLDWRTVIFRADGGRRDQNKLAWILLPMVLPPPSLLSLLSLLFLLLSWSSSKSISKMTFLPATIASGGTRVEGRRVAWSCRSQERRTVSAIPVAAAMCGLYRHVRRQATSTEHDSGGGMSSYGGFEGWTC